MEELKYYVDFVRGLYAILFGLALSEAFKQFIPDGDLPLRKDRFFSLLAFLFMILPFFHGISRYLYVTYLYKPKDVSEFAPHLLSDAAAFLLMAIGFFGMSRSLSSSHWPRFYLFLLGVLAVDSIWILLQLLFQGPIWKWLILNIVLATALLVVIRCKHKMSESIPPKLCAFFTALTTAISYVMLTKFYFSDPL